MKDNTVVLGMLAILVMLTCYGFATLRSDINNDGHVNQKDLALLSAEWNKSLIDTLSNYDIQVGQLKHTAPLKQRFYQSILAEYGPVEALWYVRPVLWCAILQAEGAGFGITQIYVDEVNRIYGTDLVLPATESEAFVLYTMMNEAKGLRTDAEILANWNSDPNYLIYITPIIASVRAQKEIYEH